MSSPNYEQDAASLHTCTRRISQHPDSEEAVRIERQRVAQELEPFQGRDLPRGGSYTSIQQGDALSRSRQPSHRSSNASNAPLQERESLESYTTTQPDTSRSQGSSTRQLHWYSPVVRFWTAHVRHASTISLTRHSTDTSQSHHRRRSSSRPPGFPILLRLPCPSH